MTTLVSNNSVQQSVVIPAQGWWLKDPLDSTANLQVFPTAPVEHNRVERQGVHYPLGRSKPVITTDTITGTDGVVKLFTLGPTQFNALFNILPRLKTLLLQSPFGYQYYVRITDSRKVVTQPGTAASAYRETDVTYVEVDMPALP